MKHLLTLFLFLCTAGVFAQDVIVKKDGSTILSKVLEVNPSDIKYKKYSNQNGPTYTIDKSEVMSINYENGESDKFNQTSNNNPQEQNSDNNYIMKAGDNRNTELISRYNTIYYPSNKLKPSKSLAKKYILIFGIKDSSVLSNEDLEITLHHEINDIEIGKGIGLSSWNYDTWVINLKNKSQGTIYIDKSHSFKVFQDGTFKAYYDNSKQYIENEGSHSGVSVGLGGIASALGVGGAAGAIASGISVGGGSSSSVSTIYNDQQIMQIPYRGNQKLTKNMYIGGNSIIESEIFDYYMLKKFSRFLADYRYNALNLPEQITNVGGVKIYSENDTPFVIRYTIAYSKTPDFKYYSTLEFEIYLHEIIGYKGIHPFNDLSSKGCRFIAEDYLDGYNDYTIYGYYDGK